MSDSFEDNQDALEFSNFNLKTIEKQQEPKHDSLDQFGHMQSFGHNNRQVDSGQSQPTLAQKPE